MRDTELFRPTITKGLFTSGQRIIMFDAVQECRAKDCPIFKSCPYAKSGKCSVETKYLKAIFESITEEMVKHMTQPLLNKITLHLIPLFHQLIRFQMCAYSVPEPVYETRLGVIKVHPIFKEIRECIKGIEATQKSMGVDLEYIAAMSGVMGGIKPLKAANPDLGDPNYYDRWQSENESQVFPEGTRKGVRRSRVRQG